MPAKMTTKQILQGIRDWCDTQLATKQDNLTFDSVPTSGSTNPVTSGGIYLSLLNYYLKSETYTKVEVNALIEAIKQFTYEVVAELPTASAATMNKIYLVPSPNPQTENAKDEYITVTSTSGGVIVYSWEQIGSTVIDLSEYPEYEETSDPSDVEMIDEYTRVLNSLYQALIDAQTATANAKADFVGSDNYIYHWNPSAGSYEKTNIYVKGDTGTTDYNELRNKPTIPDKLADLPGDAGHRTVSDAEKQTWNGKYAKPSDGIPESDCDFEVMEWEEANDPCSLLS